ncbi:3990_t:CDS:2 [Paraglomus brasilianum]|uniref:3990_t:CDS:1 n=1 Tax=Paraglomus brasilianum TaxID=144538 RepID=A0A9N8VKV0_9GLOM|nr:3990_t:CDS:2 [Paraglomus brasilianum]
MSSSSSSRQTTHRRTTSLNAFNSSSDNLLAVPNQTIGRQASQQLSPIVTQKNCHLSVIPEKLAPLTPPLTPSKMKPFEQWSWNWCDPKYSKYTSVVTKIKNVVFPLAFFIAIFVFLSSLGGLGPIDDELKVNSQSFTPVENTISHEPIFNNDYPGTDEHTDHNEDPFGISQPSFDGTDNWNGNTNDNVIHENYDEQPYNVEASSIHMNVNEDENRVGDYSEGGNNDDGNNGIDNNNVDYNYGDNNDGDNTFNENNANNNVNNPVNDKISDLVEPKNTNYEGEDTDSTGRLLEAQDGVFNDLKNQNDGGDHSSNINSYADYLRQYAYVRSDPHYTYTNALKSLTAEDKTKLAELRSEIAYADESADISCGSWQEKYTRLHEDMREGKRPPRFVSYVCDESSDCGGLADRLLGMSSTFIFALLTDRAFLAEWRTPIPLEAIFESPNIDWGYDSSDPGAVLKDLIPTPLDVVNFSAQHIDRLFLHSNWTIKYPEPFIKFHTNRGMVLRTFSSRIYAPQLNIMGLRPHTSFGCILDYLFRPSPPAMSFVAEYAALFTLPRIFSVGIQIGTGEIMNDYSVGNSRKYSLHRYRNFFKCADELVETYAMPWQKVVYYLVTDSETLRNEAMTMENVIISGLPIGTKAENGPADPVHNAVIENWILSKTNYRIISPGSLGKLAALHSKTLHSTITIYPQTETNLQNGYHRSITDCTKEDAFTMFREFASDPSLA